MKKTIPLFNFPMEVVFIDDDPSFLKSLVSLMADVCPIKTFFNTNHALQYLARKSETEEKLHFLLKESVKNGEEDDEEYRKINLDSLGALFRNRSKILDTAVVIVDYNMRELNGVDFCNKMNNGLIKKVIMTAGMEEGKALKAFNQGIIDYFISKKEDTFCDSLVSAIHKMQSEYFIELSRKLGIIRDTEGSQDFIDEFNVFLKKNEITEYYALDDFGSYIGFDEKKESHFFLCWKDRKLEELHAIAKACQAEPFIVKALQEKTHGVFLFSESDKQKNVSEWKHYLYPLKRNLTISDSTYYISYN